MPPVVLEHTISLGERPQTYVLERAATATGQQVQHCFTEFAVIYAMVKIVCVSVLWYMLKVLKVCD